MTKEECIGTYTNCIHTYMDMVEVGAKVEIIENDLSKALGVDSCEKFGEIFDKLAYVAFDAIAHLKFGNNISTCDYENFLATRMDQHMMDFLDLVAEKSLGTFIPENWVSENILTLIKD